MTPNGAAGAHSRPATEATYDEAAKRRLVPRPSRPTVAVDILRVLQRRRPQPAVRRRSQLVRRSLVVADLPALLGVFAVAELYVLAPARGADGDRIGIYLGFALVTLAFLGLHGLYSRDDVRADHTTVDDVPAILHAVTLSAFASLVVTEVTGGSSTTAVLVAWFAGLIFLPVARAAARMVARRSPSYLQKTIILGAGDVGQLMARKLLSHPEYGLVLEGFVDAAPRSRGDDIVSVPVLGGPERLPALIRERGVERVIVAFSRQSHTDELDSIRVLKDLDVQVDVVPRLFEVVGPSADINVFEGLSVFALPPMRLSRAALLTKRTLDIVVASIGLVAVAPLVVLIAFVIKLDTKGPLLYKGPRVGPRGRIFSQLKFRSMDPRFASPEGHGEFCAMLDRDPAMRLEYVTKQKLVDDPRVTRVGRLLRRTSLDELPQLLNVLRGDLSLVGPRPITAQELCERYKPRILDPVTSDSLLVGYWDSPGLRPGLTGYWQISGRSTMSFDERIRLDTAYLTSWSLKLDVEILAKTARALVASRGAY